MKTEYIKVTFSRGEFIDQLQFKNWTKEQKENADNVEKTFVFTDFKLSDKGRSRDLVCVLNANHPSYEANAKIIASAPDLLEAAIMFTSSKGSKTFGYYSDGQLKAIQLMKEAIKKATS